MPMIDKIVDWIGTDDSKLDALDHMVFGRSNNKVTHRDISKIHNVFRKYYRKQNPKSTDTESTLAFRDYIDRLEAQFKDDPAGFEDAIRQLKGSPLILDELMDLISNSGMGDAGTIKDAVIDRIKSDDNVQRLFFSTCINL